MLKHCVSTTSTILPHHIHHPLLCTIFTYAHYPPPPGVMTTPPFPLRHITSIFTSVPSPPFPVRPLQWFVPSPPFPLRLISTISPPSHHLHFPLHTALPPPGNVVGAKCSAVSVCAGVALLSIVAACCWFVIFFL